MTEPSIRDAPDRAVNQWCTKRKKKRKQVDVMKEYRQMPAAIELVEDRKARGRASLQSKCCSPQRPPVEQPQPRCGRSAAMVKRRSWVTITVCPCLRSSLTHHRNIEDKEWEIHIFIKNCVRSFMEVRKLCLIMFPLIFIFVYVFVYTTLKLKQSKGSLLPREESQLATNRRRRKVNFYADYTPVMRFKIF